MKGKVLGLTHHVLRRGPPRREVAHGLAVFRPQALRAFTILEVCISMTIGLLLIGVATLGISGIQDEARLKDQAADIEATVRSALLDAISQHQTVQLALDGSFSAGGQVEVRRYGESKYRPARKGEHWEFSPTGVCEPIELRLTSEYGVIELGFDPLTGCARKRNLTVKS